MKNGGKGGEEDGAILTNRLGPPRYSKPPAFWEVGMKSPSPFSEGAPPVPAVLLGKQEAHGAAGSARLRPSAEAHGLQSFPWVDAGYPGSRRVLLGWGLSHTPSAL